MGLLNSALIVPLASDDGWKGLIMFVAQDIAAYTDEQVELMANLTYPGPTLADWSYYSRVPVVITERASLPAATVAGVMAVSLPFLPMVYCETVSEFVA